jgi:hypothetical protein
MPGRHASPAGPSFYRDLLTMLGGILAVAVLVYLGLSALSNSDEETPTSTTGPTSTLPDSTTSTAASSSTTISVTTTTRATSTTTTTPTTSAVRPPDEITVQVLNSGSVQGLAARVTTDLAALGYNTLIPTNYPQTLSQSRIWYTVGFEAEAEQLLTEFPDALVEEPSPDLSTEADIVIVLGTSFEG